MWDNLKIGPGAVPCEIEQGWLEIYHGVDENERYCLGALLLDKREPWTVIGRSRHPILGPDEAYECQGFFGHVVFTCGVLVEEEKLKIYYGAADASVCYAEIPIGEVINDLVPSED